MTLLADVWLVDGEVFSPVLLRQQAGVFVAPNLQEAQMFATDLGRKRREGAKEVGGHTHSLSERASVVVTLLLADRGPFWGMILTWTPVQVGKFRIQPLHLFCPGKPVSHPPRPSLCHGPGDVAPEKLI